MKSSEKITYTPIKEVLEGMIPQDGRISVRESLIDSLIQNCSDKFCLTQSEAETLRKKIEDGIKYIERITTINFTPGEKEYKEECEKIKKDMALEVRTDCSNCFNESCQERLG